MAPMPSGYVRATREKEEVTVFECPSETDRRLPLTRPWRKGIEVRPAHLPAIHLRGDEGKGLWYCMSQMRSPSPARQPTSGIYTRKGYYKSALRNLEVYSSMNRVIVRMLACFANVVEGPADMAVNTHRGTSSLVFPVHSRPPRLLNSGSHMLQRTCIT